MTDQPPPPTIDRALLSRDLASLAATVTRLSEPRIPAPLRMVLSRAGIDLATIASEICSRPLALSDDELVELVDGLATELGAIRRVREPAELTLTRRAAIAALERTLL